MKTRVKMAFFLSFLFLFILWLVGKLIDNTPPKDFEFSKRYFTDSKVYDEVKGIVINNRIYRLSLMSVLVDTRSVVGWRQRLNIWRLLWRLGVDQVDLSFSNKNHDDINEVLFVLYADGFVLGGQDKGVAFRLEPPPSDQIVDDLDEYRKGLYSGVIQAVNGKMMYVPLENGWYLFYQYWD